MDLDVTDESSGPSWKTSAVRSTRERVGERRRERGPRRERRTDDTLLLWWAKPGDSDRGTSKRTNDEKMGDEPNRASGVGLSRGWADPRKCRRIRMVNGDEIDPCIHVPGGTLKATQMQAER